MYRRKSSAVDRDDGKGPGSPQRGGTVAQPGASDRGLRHRLRCDPPQIPLATRDQSLELEYL